MSQTQMVQIALDGRKLTKWAFDRRLGSDDLGYATHALMCDAFGALRLQPFVAEEKMGRVKVLGYGTATAAEMETAMAECAEPEAAAVVLSVASKVMPSEWQAGRRYAFRVRVAPTRQGHHPDGKRREGDALLFEPEGSDREATYLRWLEQRLGDAADLASCAMVSYRQIRATRRAVKDNGKRPAVQMNLPEAVFEGVLRVKDSEAFIGMLARGLGRHRAFGFGALMVRPAA